MQDLPPLFLMRMQDLLGQESEIFSESLRQPPIQGVRFNPLKLDEARFRTIFTASIQQIPWCKSGFSFSPEADFKPGKHPYHSAGLYYLQEPSGMAAAELMAPQPGETVLDLAAAPGGKSTHLVSLMGNHGLLVANEIHPQRAWILAENLERWGSINTVVLNETPERLADRLENFFDKVLLDAPCSGEALFRRSDEARGQWTPEAVHICSLRQLDILEHAARMVRPGGKLAYCTCTFNPDENEAVLVSFLSHHPEFKLVELPAHEGMSKACVNWIPGEASVNLHQAIRIWPHKSPGEGHFIAILSKQEGQHLQGGARARRLKRTRRQTTTSYKHDQQVALQYFERFCQECLYAPGFQSEIVLRGSYIYEIPVAGLDLSGLRAIHAGRWLGEIKTARFEPSHALALSLVAQQAQRVANYQAGDPLILRYLHGEPIPSPGENGWTLLTVDGFGLGWGKRIQGILKCHYPKGLRWTR